MEVREITAKIKNTLPPQERDELVKKKRKEDDKLVTGMFEFLDAQGGWLEFTHRIYPGESVKIIKLTHGEICDLPMGIVRHLNNTKKKIRRYDMTPQQDNSGRIKPARTYETVSRVRFTPTSVL